MPNGHLRLQPLPPENERLIAAKELPKFIGIAYQTLARWRHEGFGPEWCRVGRLVYYRVASVKFWLSSRESSRTSRPQTQEEPKS